ncbi:uncharacterized protein LOC144677239 [Cetorhinus maximus]
MGKNGSGPDRLERKIDHTTFQDDLKTIQSWCCVLQYLIGRFILNIIISRCSSICSRAQFSLDKKMLRSCLPYQRQSTKVLLHPSIRYKGWETNVGAGNVQQFCLQSVSIILSYFYR